MKNSLECQITGTKRVTNNSYLKRKCEKLGIDVDTLRQYYVSKPALLNLKVQLKAKGEETTASELGTDIETVRNYITYNGKNKQSSQTKEPTVSA